VFQPVITIDGPVGAGKTTVGRLVAGELGFAFLDTGVLYRALAMLLLRVGADKDDYAQAEVIARNMNVKMLLEDEHHMLEINGEVVSEELYSPDIEQIVSHVAQQPRVRSSLLPIQRDIASTGPIVLVGRDVGSIVCPDAELKIYIDAPVAVRAERKYLEKIDSGDTISKSIILSLLQNRDEVDSDRDVSPLVVPERAIVIQSENLSAMQVATLIISYFSDLRGREEQLT